MPNGDYMEPTALEKESQLMAKLICQIATRQDGRPGRVNGTIREAADFTYGKVSWNRRMRLELIGLLTEALENDDE